MHLCVHKRKFDLLATIRVSQLRIFVIKFFQFLKQLYCVWSKMFSSKKPPFYKKSIKQPRIRFYTTYTSFFVNYILQQDFHSNKSIHYTIEFLDQIKVWCWTKLAIICPLLLLQHMAGDLVSLFCSRALQVNSPLSPKHTHTHTHNHHHH